MKIELLLKQKATHLYHKEIKDLDVKQQYNVVASIVNDLAYERIKETKTYINENQEKTMYYFSMEFLMGRLLTNNLMNLGIYQDFKKVLEKYDIDLNNLEDIESDAGLGNGGLGRLAACFLDSLASTRYSGNGITIRYRNGFFKQRFVDGEQVEMPDLWLQDGNMWEQKMIDDACQISYYGEVVEEEINGKKVYKTINDTKALAMPYDMPIIGANTKTCNILRMYDVMPVDSISNKDFAIYEKELMDITSCLYPDDSNEKGRELRLKQQYFFVSAGLNNIIKRHLKNHDNLDDFAKYNVLQINDTHPSMLVAELMRVLIDDYHYEWDQAWSITTNSIAYTNHTILAEALEKWHQGLIAKLLPRIYMIIELIDQKHRQELKNKNYSAEKIESLAIINHGMVHMANLAIVGCFSVNGVAALHTQILKEKEMIDWHYLYPNKFNNKTNGITQRRWLEYCNPELTNLLESYIGNEFKTKPVDGFAKLIDLANNEKLINQFDMIKLAKKRQLKDYILKHEKIVIDENSIFDIQIKRLHAYKRQLMNVLHIIYLYLELKENREFKANFHPQTFFFGAKAAPSYVFAKNVIKLINSLAKIINNDHEVNQHLKLVMVENYNVTYAEKLIPAANISEQISTAGYEASGTGNMKFMMNGALTIGTLDGANVEIHELVNDNNIVIFGLNKNEVVSLRQQNTYNAKKIVKDNDTLTRIFDFINNIDKYDVKVSVKDFKPILDDLLEHNDYFLVLKDFEAYKNAQAKINAMYKNRNDWNQKCLINIAKSGFFSSDRTIEEYANEIWHLNKLSL